MKTSTSARTMLLRLLARREYSASELQQKLRAKGVQTAHIQDAIAYVQHLEYQSDTRFAAQVLRHRAAQGYGPVYIEQALRSRGVAADIIDTVMQEAALDWEQQLIALLTKKISYIEPLTDTMRQKCIQTFYRRGFPVHMIHSACKTLQASCSSADKK